MFKRLNLAWLKKMNKPWILYFTRSNGLKCLVLFLTIFLLGTAYSIFLSKSLPAGRLLAPQKTIVIDPGHGGIYDRGVVHKESGVAESPINLAVSMELKQILERQGYNVILTREAESQEYREIQPELRRRVNLAESSNADILISIHVNQYPDPSCFGAQTFYNAANTESQRLALLIQEELVKLEPNNHRKALPKDLFILRESKMPSVLVEVGFISNPNDRQRLQDPTHRQQLAKAIADGIRRYFNNEEVKPVLELE